MEKLDEVEVSDLFISRIWMMLELLKKQCVTPRSMADVSEWICPVPNVRILPLLEFTWEGLHPHVVEVVEGEDAEAAVVVATKGADTMGTIVVAVEVVMTAIAGNRHLTEDVMITGEDLDPDLTLLVVIIINKPNDFTSTALVSNTYKTNNQNINKSKHLCNYRME
jgi:hypothetical protein